MSTQVKINDLGNAVQNVLNDYLEEVQDTVTDVVVKEANDCAKDIRTQALAAGIPDHKYAKSWKTKITKQTAFETSAVVYSPSKYQLAHLLEHGHPIVKNGRVVGTAKAKPHLYKAEIKAINNLENNLKKKLQEGK